MVSQLNQDLTAYPWQQGQWNRLQSQRAQDSMPHAILLVGQPGLGLDHFSRLLAQSLLCSDSRGNSYPCGECPQCRQFAQQVNPDYQYVGLLEGKKNLLVDQVRALNQFVALTGSGEAGKVIVISPADRMNVNAANSVLKTLEEPPGSVTMILVAHYLHRLPATVKSRCQMIKFTAPDREASLQWLNDRGHQRVEQLLQLGQGAPCLAEKRDDETLYEQYVIVVEGALASMQGRKIPAQLRAEWQSCDLALVVGWSLSLLRDCIRCASHLPDGRFENPAYLTNLREMNSWLHLVRLFQVYDHLARMNDSLDHPLNRDLLLDDVLLSWQSLRSG